MFDLYRAALPADSAGFEYAPKIVEALPYGRGDARRGPAVVETSAAAAPAAVTTTASSIPASPPSAATAREPQAAGAGAGLIHADPLAARTLVA